MHYDTHWRHNQALQPDALTTIRSALHAINAAIGDCERAGKSPEADAAVLLLAHNLGQIATIKAATIEELRIRCTLERGQVIDHPALLAIGGHVIGDDRVAKRTFHFQARMALGHIALALGLAERSYQISTTPTDHDQEGMSFLRHPDIEIHISPRGFLPDTEVSFARLREGRLAGRSTHLPIAILADLVGFARQIEATIGTFAPAHARAA